MKQDLHFAAQQHNYYLINVKREVKKEKKHTSFQKETTKSTKVLGAA
jgi:hypothetical protein